VFLSIKQLQIARHRETAKRTLQGLKATVRVYAPPKKCRDEWCSVAACARGRHGLIVILIIKPQPTLAMNGEFFEGGYFSNTCGLWEVGELEEQLLL
jgi:hypothetical protein